MGIRMGSIKKRITFITLFVVLLTIFLLGISVYLYFTGIFSRQIIRDNITIITKINMQISNYVSDIIDYAKVIILDDQVQASLNQKNQTKNFKYFSNIYNLEEKLNDYAILRDNIFDSIFMVDLEGKILCTNNKYGFKSEDSWYSNFITKGNKWGFSEVHIIKKSQQNREVTVISFIINVNSKSGEGNSMGRLVINLKYDVIVKSLLNNDVTVSDFLLLDQNNNIIYKSFEIEDSIYKNALNLSKDSSEPVFYHNCYFITQTIPENGWKVMGVLPYSRIMENLKFINIFFIIIGAACMALMCILIIPVVNNVTRPLMTLIHGMKEVSKGNLDTRIKVNSGDEIELLASVYNKMTDDIRNNIKESVLKEKREREMELRLFMNQINPHFMYNTLNTIIYLGRQIDAKDIIYVTQAFIRILQYTIKTQPDMITTVEDEMDYINNYMSILKYRYNDMVRLEWNIDPEVYGCKIPKLLIYPLVENSVFHGIFPLNENGSICITITKDCGLLKVLIEDNGIGMKADDLLNIRQLIGNEDNFKNMDHIGLQNVNGRLQLLYGNNHALRIESSYMEGTKVWFNIPLESELYDKDTKES